MHRREIRNYFAKRNIRQLTEDDLIEEIREATFANRPLATPIGNLSRLSKLPELSGLLTGLESHLRKFSFGEVGLEDWESRYCFPRAATIRSYKKRPGTRGVRGVSEFIVNRNKGSVDKWVRNTIIPWVSADTNAIMVLIGGVGAGKSTFNKYVTSNYFSAFRERQIVSSRVEYRKLYKYVSKHCNLNLRDDTTGKAALQASIQKYVYCCMARDFFHYGWSDVNVDEKQGYSSATFRPREKGFWPELDIESTKTNAEFGAFVTEHHAQNTDLSEVSKFVKYSIGEFSKNDPRSRSRWFKELLQSDERQALLEPLVDFANSKGIQTYVILDGLDYVQIADFIDNTSHRTIIEEISNWLTDGNPCVPLEVSKVFLWPRFQVTMRPNTYELFWRDFAQSMTETESEVYHIAPPEFRDVFASISKLAVWESEESVDHITRDELVAIFDSVQLRLFDSLSVRKRERSDLFMQNTRYRLHFVRNVTEEMIKGARGSLDEKKQPLSHDNMLRELKIEAKKLVGSKAYRLIDLLLHSKNERFANFVRIEVERLDPEANKKDPSYLESNLRDNNIQSGYIGNVFNYHIPYDKIGDIEFFLEKLRILDVLVRANGTPVSKSTIKSTFNRHNWKISSYLDFSIAILVRENLIAGFSLNAGSHGYVVTELGLLTRKRLVTDMNYLENVFFGCFLPGGIKRRARDIYRTEVQRLHWVAASVYHCWLLLCMIKTAEKDTRVCFFEEIRSSVLQTIMVITASPEKQGPEIANAACKLISEFNESMDLG